MTENDMADASYDAIISYINENQKNMAKGQIQNARSHAILAYARENHKDINTHDLWENARIKTLMIDLGEKILRGMGLAPKKMMDRGSGYLTAYQFDSNHYLVYGRRTSWFVHDDRKKMITAMYDLITSSYKGKPRPMGEITGLIMRSYAIKICEKLLGKNWKDEIYSVVKESYAPKNGFIKKRYLGRRNIKFKLTNGEVLISCQSGTSTLVNSQITLRDMQLPAAVIQTLEQCKNTPAYDIITPGAFHGALDNAIVTGLQESDKITTYILQISDTYETL